MLPSARVYIRAPRLSASAPIILLFHSVSYDAPSQCRCSCCSWIYHQAVSCQLTFAGGSRANGPCHSAQPRAERRERPYSRQATRILQRTARCMYHGDPAIPLSRRILRGHLMEQFIAAHVGTVHFLRCYRGRQDGIHTKPTDHAPRRRRKAKESG